MWISGIMRKEIGEEFLGMERAPNGFPLPCRSAASPHLDPMPVLSQRGGARGSKRC